MPQVNDLQKLIQQASFDEHHRTIILVDKTTNQKAWGRFVHRYDQGSLGRVDSYYTSTFNILSKTGASMVFTANVLPILPHLGKHQVTLVEKTFDGISVKNAVNENVNDSLGVGG